MNKRLECVVKGRVQMVLFRDFAQRTAKKLGLSGFVKNLDNGSVYAVAEGDEKSLKSFLNAMKRGSVFSKVTEVNEKWGEANGGFKDFNIRYD